MDTEYNSQPGSPWVTIWTSPRETIQRIIDTDPVKRVIDLAVLSSIAQTLNQASADSMGDQFGLGMLLLIVVIGGVLGGLLGLYVGGFFIKVTGSWLGGQADVVRVRAAIAWASVPVIASLLLWIPKSFLFGFEMFTSQVPVIESSALLSMALLVFAVFDIVLGVWAFVLLLMCLAQVQGFSVWRAFGNLVLTMLVIMVPLMIIGVAIGVATGA